MRITPQQTRGLGQCCAYCGRTLLATTNLTELGATRDHVIPRSRGRAPMGEPTVWSCRLCNQLKDDMLPEDWRDFMQCYPRWWEHPDFKWRSKVSGVPLRGELRARINAVPFEVSKRILDEGRIAKRAIPLAIPIEYPDPKAQAAFEAVYGDRRHMLRVDP